MLGGLLIMLKMTNLTTGAGLREKGVYMYSASALVKWYTNPTYIVFV